MLRLFAPSLYFPQPITLFFIYLIHLFHYDTGVYVFTMIAFYTMGPNVKVEVELVCLICVVGF